MTLRLTPDLLRAGYEFLRTTSPFKGWRLPHSEHVEFRVTQTAGEHGEYEMTKSGHDIISLSGATLGHTITIIATIAHEMVHMHMAHNGTIDRNDLHGEEFQRLAKIVCKNHGFDWKWFV